VDDFWSAGLSAAFGCEYFFHRQFSIGGEFGVNLFYGSWDHAGVEGTTDIEATYTALTLNFLL
jgi:hypothetical protein